MDKTIFFKFHDLKQKYLSIEKYTIEFEQLMMKCDIVELEEQTVARYLGSLKTEIGNTIQLMPYGSTIFVSLFQK